jgi:uncharacterized membrane protein
MQTTEDAKDIVEVRRSFALPTNRIESLSDCIFAFAMTLLVLGIQLPVSTSAHSLLRTLLHLQSELTTYLLSFIVLGGLWIAHHNQYFWIKKSNRPFLWINMLYLLFISFIPFSTKVLAGYSDEYVAVIIYGLNIILCLVMLYIHWFYATRKRMELVEHVNSRIVLLIETRLITLIILNIIAITIAFFSRSIGVATLIVVQLFGVIPNITIDRLIIRAKKAFSSRHVTAV